MVYRVDGLKSRIVTALGLTPLMMATQAGCSVRSLDGPDDIGGDASADDGNDDGSSDDGSSATSTETGDGTADGEGSSDSSPPPMQTCWPSDDWLEWELWMPTDASGQCDCGDECQAAAQSQWDEENCCSSCWYSFGWVECQEVLDDQCHYIVMMQEEGCGKGRPLMVDEHARVAEPCLRDDWAEAPALPRVDGLDAEHRRALAEVWTQTALAEHASVASFARFALDLTALGAPPDLLLEATAAMQDEVRHAQVAFALAGAYAGRPVGPGPLSMEGVTAGGDAEAMVRAAVREGCVEETLAAAEAELAARRATDPAIRAALARIADDEARHAVLAWRFVDWAVRRDPSLAAAVSDELRRAGAAAEASPPPGPADRLPSEIASAHGVLPPEIRGELRATCLRDTVRPCGAAMLGGQDLSGPATPQA